MQRYNSFFRIFIILLVSVSFTAIAQDKNVENNSQFNFATDEINSCDLDGMTTFTQGGWGTKASGGNPGSIRDAHFNAVFPNGIVITGGSYTLTFTSSSAVKDFLPAGGTSKAMTKNLTNPTKGKDAGGVLGGQVVAATLNVEYDRAGKIGTGQFELGELVFTSGPFQGWTIDAFLTLAKTALTGGNTQGYSYSAINDAATSINENFDNGTQNQGHFTCPASVKGSLGDKVWLDANENGIQDNNESGVGNVTVKLYDSNNQLLDTKQTTQNGAYLFEDLDADDYYVVFELPAGYEFTAKDAGNNENLDSDANTTTGKTDNVTLGAGENITTVDAGIKQLKASLGDYVWLDANKNGVQDGSEAGVENITVKLYKSDNTLLATTITNNNGLYSFTNLDPDTYYVEFVLPSGYAFTSKDAGNNDQIDSDANTSTGKTDNVTLAGGDNNVTLDAGIYSTHGSIGDYVWYDADHDGVQDNNESGVENVTVKLYTCADLLKATTTTDQDGMYLFDDLLPGDYYVEFTLPNGYEFSSKDTGSDDNVDSDADVTTGKTDCTTLGVAENITHLDAGIFEPKSSVGDYVWEDTNENGIQDNGESGLVNVPVELYTCNDQLLAQTTTDQFGKYEFAGLDAGDYYIKVLKPNGYFFTTANSGNNDAIDSDVDALTGIGTCFTLGTNEDNPTLDAGLYQPTSGVGNFVWVDADNDGIQDNGEAGKQGVVVKLYNCNDALVSTTLTNGNGVYQFSNIPSGDYYVKFELPNSYTFSSKDAGNDNSVDSDVDGTTGRTDCFSLEANTVDNSWDAGIYMPPSDVDLVVVKTVDESNPEDGDQITFTITVTNNGPSNADDVEVTDILAQEFVLQSANATQGTFDDFTGEWAVGSLNSGSSATLTLNVEVSLGIASAFDLGFAKSFNLFLFGDLYQPSSDTEGKVAAGGNVSLSNYSVGYLLENSNGLVDALVVGGHLQFETGAVYGGNAVYGTSTNLPKQQVSIEGTLRQDNPIDFAAAETQLKGLAATLSAYNANGDVDQNFSDLQLNGTSPYLNVFDVDGDVLSAVTSMSVNVPNGSVVLVNVSGNNIDWNGGLTVNGTAVTNVLYNFYEAHTLYIHNIDVLGSVLAPYADLELTSVINGQVIAQSMTGTGQFNYKLFTGNIPVQENIANCAELTNSNPLDGDNSNNSSCVTVVVGDTTSSGGTGTGTNYEWQVAGETGISETVWSLGNDANGNMLAGTVGGKIFKSVDLGQTWTRINESMTVTYIWSLAKDDNGKLYAGTEKGLYYSEDDGTTWDGPVLSGKDVRTVKLDGFGNIYAGVWGEGVYKSADGTNFAATNSGFGSLAIHALAVNSNNVIYAGIYDDGVYKSFDLGATWTKTSLSYRYVWALGVTSDDVLYAGTYGGGVYTSEDDGDSWYLIGGTAPYIYAVTVDAADNVFVTSWDSGVYMLTQNGPQNDGSYKGNTGNLNTAAWMRLGLEDSGVSSLLINVQDANLYAGGDDGVVYKLVLADVTAVENEEADILPTEYNLAQNYPNPFNPSTTISFGVKDDGNFRLAVYNLLGEEVAVLANDFFKAGSYNFTFDASKLASGVYLYRLTGSDVNLVKKMMLLK